MAGAPADGDGAIARQHVVQFYEADEYLVEVVSRFLRAGLVADEAAVVIATEAHRAGFVGALAAAGIDVARAEAEGQLVLLDADATLGRFMVEGMPARAKFEALLDEVQARLRRSGRPRLRAYGEMVDLLWREGNQTAAFRLEELWNERATRDGFALLCAYSMGHFYRAEPVGGLDRICAQHAEVHPPAGPAAALLPAAAGSAERTRSETLEEALREALAGRQRAHAELRAKADELADFAENATEGLHSVDAAGVVIWANRAMLELLGCTREELIGQPIVSFHVEPAAARALFARLAAGEVVRNHETRLRARDGSIKYVAISANVYWSEGRFGHARCFTRDVTAQKAMADARDASARRLAILAEASRTFAASASDLDGLLAAVGQQVSAACDGSCEIALINGEDKLESRFVYDQDPEACAALRELLTGTLRERGAGIAGQVVARGTALRLPVVDQVALRAATLPGFADFLARYPVHSLLLVPLRASGRVLGTLGSARYRPGQPFTEADEAFLQDLADRAALAIDNAYLYQRERRAREAAEHAASRTRRLQELTAALAIARTPEEVAQVMVDAGRAALDAAAGFAWLLGPDESTLEMCASAGFSGPRVDAYRRISIDADLPLCHVLRTGAPMMFDNPRALAEGYPATGAGGPSGFGSWAVLPFFVAGRGVGGVSLSFGQPRRFGQEDADLLLAMAAQAASALERCRLFEAEKSARARSEAADRRKDEFLAMLGHELRNPLAPIQTALQLMRLRDEQVGLRERMIIERQVGHLERLIDDLLDVSRITRGRIELKRERREVADVIAKAIEQAAPLLEHRNHRLHLEVPRHGLAVDGDQVRLAQVFANLLTNAAKYTEPGGDISVTAAREADQCVVRVRDNGVGIASELLPRVFELFSQATQTLARSQGGLGLGLAIVERLVSLHGGRVAAHSDGPGHGSEFAIWLPLAPALASSAPAGPTHAAPKATVARTARPRVLIVDDNLDGAEILGEALTMTGYDVHTAHDGPAALRAAAELTPDFALLDIGLPVMDGYELARRLRDLCAKSPLKLFAVTGYGQERDRTRALEAGFDEHLVKPVDLDRLLALLAGSDA